MGDLAARPAGIICTPETTRVVLSEAMGGISSVGSSTCQSASSGAGLMGGGGTVVGSSGSGRVSEQGCILVLASDGVWDFMSNKEVVDMVGNKLSLGLGGQKQEQQCQQRWDHISTPGLLGGTSLSLPPPAARPSPAATTTLSWAGRQRTGGDSAPSGAGPGSVMADVACLPAPVMKYAGLRAPLTLPASAAVGETTRDSEVSSGMMGGGGERERIRGSLVSACEAVAKESVSRWIAEYGGQYIDDITIVIAQFEPASDAGPTCA